MGICTILYYFLVLFSCSTPTPVHCCSVLGTEEASDYFNSQKNIINKVCVCKSVRW